MLNSFLKNAILLLCSSFTISGQLSIVYWSSWSSCNVSYGDGFMNRTRLFNVVNDTSCGNENKVEKCFESFWLENEIELSKGNLLATFKRISKEYSMSFDIKPTDFLKVWTSVIRLTIGGDGLHYGDRNPAVFFFQNIAMISSSLNNTVKKDVNAKPIELGSWSTFEISQKFVEGKYMYSVQLNGANIIYAENTNATELFNVKLYASDPWYDAQPGFVRNITVTNGNPASLKNQCNSTEVFAVMYRTKRCNVQNVLEWGFENKTEIKSCFGNQAYPESFWMENEIELSKGNLLATFKRISKEYSVSFDVKPTGFLNYWASVIHLTIGNDNSHYGDRIPAVFFYNLGVAHICSSMNNIIGNCINTQPLKLGSWSTFEISQKFIERKYMYSVQLNGTNISYVENTDAREFVKVKLYVSDPWFDAQPGLIRKIKVWNGISELWSQWSEWSTCNSSCVTTRSCNCLNCIENKIEFETESCNFLYEVYWSSWSSCNVSYGNGFMNRTRLFNVVNDTCCGNSNGVKECFETFWMENEIELSKGNLLATFKRLSKEYSVSFDVKPTVLSNYWTNVIRLTIGNDNSIYGDRVPAVFFRNDTLGVARICSSLNNIKDNCIDIQSLKLGSWYTFEISQIFLEGKYMYSVLLNGTNISYVENTDAREFVNVKLYVSDPWFDAQPGFIKNIKVSNGNSGDFLIEQETLFSRGNLVATFKQFYKEYKVYFEFKPSFINSGTYYSLVHLTTGTETLVCGDRHPGVWFDSPNFRCLLIYSCINGYSEYIVTNPVQPLTWSSIKILQELLDGKYIYSIYINGTQVFNKQNNDAREFSNSKVYISNPWDEPQPGYIRNLKITNIKPGTNHLHRMTPMVNQALNS